MVRPDGAFSLAGPFLVPFLALLLFNVSTGAQSDNVFFVFVFGFLHEISQTGIGGAVDELDLRRRESVPGGGQHNDTAGKEDEPGRPVEEPEVPSSMNEAFDEPDRLGAGQ